MSPGIARLGGNSRIFSHVGPSPPGLMPASLSAFQYSFHKKEKERKKYPNAQMHQTNILLLERK